MHYINPISDNKHSAYRLIILSLAVLLFLPMCCKKEVDSKQPPKDLLAIFQQTPDETVKPTIWDTGDTTISNEDRLDLFYNNVKDIGGGYVGLGGTQNFLLASWANSEWIWLFDFTKIVVATNNIQIAFLKNSSDPESFIQLWNPKNAKKAREIISKEYMNHPEHKFILKALNKVSWFINKRFNILKMLTKKRNYKIWLNDQFYYDRIRKLALDGKILTLKGDLNGPVTIKGIASTAKKMKVNVRILYFSNAEEYFKTYSPQFRDNFTQIPIDDQSIVLRTVSIYRRLFPWSPDSEHSTDRGFHYNVMKASVLMQWLKDERHFRVADMLKTGKVDKTNGFSLIDVYPVKK